MKNVLKAKALLLPREKKLSALIRKYLRGDISKDALLQELQQIYNRIGDGRNTALQPSPSALGTDPLYRQIHTLLTGLYPLSSNDLRQDQIDSYVNTVSARAVTAERLSEYQNRGVQMVQIVAYLDDATTDICRMMNGRTFAIDAGSANLSGQQPLVLSESFWSANNHFSQTPTALMEPFLPPYHYNCRTRIVPYIEPTDPFESALDRYNNLTPFRDQHVDAIVNKASKYEFASREMLFEHTNSHKKELGISTQKEYLSMVSNLLNNPLKQMGLAISARDRSLNLYVWNPMIRMIDGIQKHDFAVFSLDKNTLKTFHPKSLVDIMKNLDPSIHGKVMLLSDQKITKGVTMVGAYDVMCYARIITYIETDDSTDEQEMLSRIRFETEWDSISEPLKQRILAVDNLVLEKYADWFDYNVFNDYIKTIKNRQQIEQRRAHEDNA